jgi:hypothetical protein
MDGMGVSQRCRELLCGELAAAGFSHLLGWALGLLLG